MILLNLLPHREAARKKRRDMFNVSLALAALLGAAICGAVYLWYEAQITNQQTRNNYLQAENKRLDEKIKEIANLQSEIAALKARQQAVEDLQGDRNLPVHLLNELARQLPDGVYVTTMRQDGPNVALTGVAQSNERVSELLRNLANNSPWLTKPELVEITASTIALSSRDQRRVANFSMRVKLVRPTDAEKAAAAAASAAASGTASAPAQAASR
ncbi:MAG: PilN domain-containing protein [Pseudomonadota bacterium]